MAFSYFLAMSLLFILFILLEFLFLWKFANYKVWLQFSFANAYPFIFEIAPLILMAIPLLSSVSLKHRKGGLDVLPASSND